MHRALRPAGWLLALAGLACGSDSPTGPGSAGSGRIAFVESVVKQPVVIAPQYSGSQLGVMEVDGSGSRQLTPATTYVWSYDWSTRGGRVAYKTNSTDPWVYVRADDGSLVDQFDTSTNLAASAAYDLSPDGTQLAYLNSGFDGVRLWVLTIATRQKRELARDDYGIAAGLWSPDGQWIAFVQGGVMWKIRPDGTGRTRMAAVANFDRMSWSPDGRMLAMHGPMAVTVMNADGSNLRQLTSFDRYTPVLSSPRWSPDGRRLLVHIYVAGMVGDQHLLGMRVNDGAIETRITGAISEGDWSPDGSRILYVKLQPRELVTVRLDGSGEEVIRVGPISQPRWLR